MPFQKGQSGNPKGAPRKEDTLRTWLIRMGQQKNEDGVTRDEAVIAKLYTLAEAGDKGAIRLILEFRVGRSALLMMSALEAEAARDGPVKMYISVSPDDWPDPPGGA